MSVNLWDTDDERNVQYYTELIGKYGVDVRALNWGSRESQQLRFSILAHVGQLSGATVLDVGCGMGDFFGWLKDRGVNVKYTGIDITPKMIETARERFPEAQFEVKSVHEIEPSNAYDYAIASGIFYYRQTEPFQFMKEMIARLFRTSNTAIAFNSLSGWAPEKDGKEFYANPLETLTFCRNLTSWVVLRHDYHLRDFTIYLYKKEPLP
jgi:SAM-dependent methyltransferase